jgi:hypothetical protein
MIFSLIVDDGLMRTPLAIIFDVYAANVKGRIYHLVRGPGVTVCGLRVSQLILAQAKGASLRLVRNPPPGQDLCKHCERLETGNRDD